MARILLLYGGRIIITGRRPVVKARSNGFVRALFSRDFLPERRLVILFQWFVVLSICLPHALFAEAQEAGSFPYKLQWKYFVPDALKSSVVEGDSLFFVATTEGRLSALRKGDGVRVWRRRDLGPVNAAPVVWNGQVIVADAWGFVRSLQADTGAESWSFQRIGGGRCVLTQADSSLYVSAADGWLYALEVDGRERWRVRTGKGGALGVTTSDGSVYAGLGSGWLSLDAASGQRIFKRDIRASAATMPSVIDGRLIVAMNDGYVRSDGLDEGKSSWRVWLGGQPMAPPVAAGDYLICAVDNGYLYALSARDGKIAWRRRIQGGMSGGAVVGAQGEIVVGSKSGEMTGFDPISGEVRWSVQVGREKGLRVYATKAGLWAVADDGHAHVFTPLKGDLQRDKTAMTAWWELFVDGQKTGYRYERVMPGTSGGWEIEVREFDWRGGYRRSARGVAVQSDFRPIRAWATQADGNQVVRERARWRGDVVEVEQTLAGYAHRDSAVADRRAVDKSVIWRKLAREGRLLPEQSDSLRVFDWTTRQSYWIHMLMGAEEMVSGDKALRVDAVQKGHERSATTFWVDRAGRVLRVWQPSRRVEQRLTDRMQAERWSPPAAEEAIVLDRPIDRRAALDRLVVRLPETVVDPNLWIEEDAWQRVYRDTTGRLLLSLERRQASPLPTRLPIGDTALRSYLSPSLYVHSNDPRVRAIAAQLKGNDRDAWTVAVRIRRWVYDHMVPRNTNVRFKSSSEVLDDMEGTCSEYAALYMALCRAAGIPVRASAGWVIGDGGTLVLHIWCQVFAGVWIDVDPTQSTEAIGAGYIKTSSGLLTPQGLRQMSAPLSRWMAAVDTLWVAEYEVEGRRYELRAAELFARAGEAERNFEDARAIDLYHQIDRLPWNSRSAEALIRIARYRLRRGEWDDARWALDRVMRQRPRGDSVDDALFYRAKLAEARGDSAAAVLDWQTLVRDFADSELADEALGQLAARAEQREGCAAALPYYERLREQYSRSGWAAVARSAIERCR